MEKNLKKGLKFTSKHFKGHVEILEVNEAENILVVKSVRRFDRYHTEDWNLEHTIVGFNRGDYRFDNSLVDTIRVNSDTIGCVDRGEDIMISIQVHNPNFQIKDYYFTKSQIQDLINQLERFR